MPNAEHFKILLQGVETWNEWRRQWPEIRPHLNDADLSNIDLGGAYLRYALLGRVNFSGANLVGADLLGALLNGANLFDAHLVQADLRGVKFGNTNLSYSNLSNADLSYAIFQNSILSGTNFTDCFWGGTIFSEVDLSEVKGLETGFHFNPSTIGIDTIYKSHNNIPENFLRRCGLPEDFITYMRSLVGKAIEFYSCFISYSSKDDEFAKRLYADLQNEGVRCWFAPEDLKIGERFRVKIDESIRLYDKLLLVLSENSVASAWVEDEVEAALEKEREQNKTVLFPVRLDGAVMEVKGGWPAAVRRNRHIGDFSDWKSHDSYKRGFERLMRDLKAEARRES